MSDYKVVFRADNTNETEQTPQWEPACPALVEAVQVSRHTVTSDTYLQVRVENLCARTLGAIYGTATLAYDDGSQETVEFKQLDADIAPRESQALQAIALPRPDVKSARVSFTRIDCDGRQWGSSVDPIDPPTSKPLGFGIKAMEERNRRLKEEGFNPDFLSGALEVHNGWWLCSCGHLNVNRTKCCGCGCEKKLLVELGDEQTLEAEVDSHRSKLYDQAIDLLAEEPSVNTLSRAQQLLEQAIPWKDSTTLLETCSNQLAELKSRRTGKIKKRALIIGGCLVATAAVALLLVFLVVPMVKYNDAVAKADAGDFQGSISMLQELGSFNGADAMIPQIEERERQARYDAAVAAMDNGDYEAAYYEFEELGEFMNTSEKQRECAQNAAQAYEEAGEIAQAISWYSLLGDEKVYEAKYNYIKEHFNPDDPLTYEYLGDLKRAKYKDAEGLYTDLFAVTGQIIFNTDRTDTSTSYTTIGSKSKSMPWVHVYLEGGYSGAGVRQFDVKECWTWGPSEDRIASGYDTNNRTYERNLEPGWNTLTLEVDGSNVYDHKLTITDPETGLVVAEAELHTPYNDTLG